MSEARMQSLLELQRPKAEVSTAQRPAKDRKSSAKDLDQFKEQFYQWYFVDKYHLETVKQKFDRLFEALFISQGKRYQARQVWDLCYDKKDWRNRLRAWNTGWKLRKRDKRQLAWRADLDRQKLYYEASRPLLPNLPSGWNMDQWPQHNSANTSSLVDELPQGFFNYEETTVGESQAESDLGNDIGLTSEYPSIAYAPEFDHPISSQSDPLKKILPASDPACSYTDAFYGFPEAGLQACWPQHVGPHPATALEDYSHGITPGVLVSQDTTHLGHDMSYVGSQPPYLTTADSGEGLPEYDSLDRDLDFPPNGTGGSQGKGLLSRKRRQRASFVEPPCSRMKSPPCETSTVRLLDISSLPGTLADCEPLRNPCHANSIPLDHLKEIQRFNPTHPMPYYPKPTFKASIPCHTKGTSSPRQAIDVTEPLAHDNRVGTYNQKAKSEWDDNSVGVFTEHIAAGHTTCPSENALSDPAAIVYASPASSLPSNYAQYLRRPNQKPSLPQY